MAKRGVRNAPFCAQIITIRLQNPAAYKVFRLLFDMMVGHEDSGRFSGVRRGHLGTEFAGRPARFPAGRQEQDRPAAGSDRRGSRPEDTAYGPDPSSDETRRAAG